MVERSPNGKKTLREKEKLLVTSNFSFSHSVFKRLVLQTRKNQGLFGKGLTYPKLEEYADDKMLFRENDEHCIWWAMEKAHYQRFFFLSKQCNKILFPQIL